MKRDVINHNDLTLTVAAINWPALTPADKHLLVSLALTAHFDKNLKRWIAHPGKAALAQRLGCSLKTVYNRFKRPVELGIITLAHEGHGEGNANAYAFCLSHDAYPDSYLNISKKVAEAARESGNSGYRKPIENAVTGSDECGNFEGQNAVNISQESGNSGYPPPLTTKPRLQPRLTEIGSDIAATIADDERRGSRRAAQETVSDVAGIVTAMYVEKEQEAPKGSMKQPTREMISLAKQHGREKFLAAAKAWLQANPWNDETAATFSTFLGANFVKYLALADKAAKYAARNVDQKLEGEVSARMSQIHRMSADAWIQEFATAEEKAQLARLEVTAQQNPYDLTDADVAFACTLAEKGYKGYKAQEEQRKANDNKASDELFPPDTPVTLTESNGEDSQ